MANASDFYQSPLLTNLAQRWRNTKLIADQLFPIVPVPKDLFGYLSWNQDIAYRIQDDRMAPYASANQLDIDAIKVFQKLTDKALKAYIDPKEEKQNPELQMQMMKTGALKDSLLLAQENRCATLLRNTSTYASSANYTTLSGTAQWDNAAGDPKSLILAARDSLLIPSDAELVLWMGKQVYTQLQMNAKVIAAVQYSQGSVDTRDILARYLQVDRILVGEAFSATNNLGQTLATQRIWGKDAGLLVVNKNAPTGIAQLPTFGIWACSTEGGKSIWRTYLGRDADRGTSEGVTVVKVEGTYDLIVQANSLGYLWKSAVS